MTFGYLRSRLVHVVVCYVRHHKVCEPIRDRTHPSSTIIVLRCHIHDIHAYQVWAYQSFCVRIFMQEKLWDNIKGQNSYPNSSAKKLVSLNLVSMYVMDMTSANNGPRARMSFLSYRFINLVMSNVTDRKRYHYQCERRYPNIILCS